MNLYTVYDRVREDYAPPFVAKNDNEASRLFVMNIKKMVMANDLELFCIAEWEPDEKDRPLFGVSFPRLVPVALGDKDEE